MTSGESYGSIKPGDPPPFWEGPWHPQGRSEGAVLVKARPTNAATPFPPAGATPPPVRQTPPPAPAKPPTAAAPGAQRSTSPSTNVQSGATRSLITNLLVHGHPQPISALPPALDAAAATALRQQAKESQAAGQLPQTVALLTEALKFDARDAGLYAQFGHALMAARVPEDAAHHFLLAYMLAPQDIQVARLALHAAWALGYVGWAFQIAQALHKRQPAPEWVELGKAAAVWLRSSRPAARTLLCTTCRVTAVVPPGVGCPKCGKAGLGAPAQDAALAGLRVLQQSPPKGRLFVGATCQQCRKDTVLIVKAGGLQCLRCQAPPLPTVKLA